MRNSKNHLNLHLFDYISIRKEECASVRGNPKIQCMPYYSYSGRTLNAFNIPIHSLTHLNFPKKFPLKRISQYSKPEIFNNVIIINCTDKKKYIEKILVECNDIFQYKNKLPYLEFKKDIPTEDVIIDTLIGLEIEHEYILNKLHKQKLSDINYLLFFTDWTSFIFSESLSANDELLHAYLLHPYLSRATIGILKLKMPNLVGIGIDTPSFNNPAKFVDLNNSHPAVQRTYNKIKNESLFPTMNYDISEEFIKGYIFSKKIRKDKIVNIFDHLKVDEIIAWFKEKNIQLSSSQRLDQTIFRPHFGFIDGKRKYLIKNDEVELSLYHKDDKLRYILLNLSFEIFKQKSESKNECTNGELILIPVPSLMDSSGIVCELYFKPFER